MSDIASPSALAVEERIRVTLTDGVADVRLTRADKMNALDDAMFQALVDTGAPAKSRWADTSETAVLEYWI